MNVQINAGATETVTYLHTDHLGTPRAGSNAAGAVVWAWANDAFGISAPTGSVSVNLRMAGQYADSESGLFYNGNRYYKPSIGRYISSDPIGLAGGLNTFGYVAQNPMNAVDPSGLQTVPIPSVPGLPIFIPPIAIPGSPENQQWVNWMEGKADDVGKAIVKMCASDEADTNLEPPGDCTPEQQQRYQRSVENECGKAKACYGTDSSVAILSQKIGQQSRCIAARKLINSVCFRGGNRGHNKEIEQRVSAIKNCQSIIAQQHLR